MRPLLSFPRYSQRGGSAGADEGPFLLVVVDVVTVAASNVGAAPGATLVVVDVAVADATAFALAASLVVVAAFVVVVAAAAAFVVIQ